MSFSAGTLLCSFCGEKTLALLDVGVAVHVGGVGVHVGGVGVHVGRVGGQKYLN